MTRAFRPDRSPRSREHYLAPGHVRPAPPVTAVSAGGRRVEFAHGRTGGPLLRARDLAALAALGGAAVWLWLAAVPLAFFVLELLLELVGVS